MKINSFKHLIVTRLNIRPVDLSTGKVTRLSFEDEWMEERISYLQDYCLPSILNQECNDFDWLVYLDTGTKEKYKCLVQEILKKRHCRSHIGFTESGLTFVQDLRSTARQLCSDSKYLITTRLDSDDALQRNGISRIQKAFQDNVGLLETEPRIAINLLCGYQLRVKPFYELVWKRMSSNPFISLIEKTCYEIETPYKYFHNDLKGIKIIDISGGVYWLQTVHSKNMHTDVVGWPSLQIEVLEEFGISCEEISISPATFLSSLHNRIWFSLGRRLQFK